MFRAKPLARTEGCVTFAKIVLVGPVLKNRQNTARKAKTHAPGKGTTRNRSIIGKPKSMAPPDTRKYEPGKRLQRRSPAMPPRIVAIRPERAVMIPNVVRGGMPKRP